MIVDKGYLVQAETITGPRAAVLSSDNPRTVSLLCRRAPLLAESFPRDGPP